MEILDATEGLLTRMAFTALRSSVRGREVLIFEDDSVIGFVFSYTNARSLIAGWGNESEAAVSAHQLALRRAGPKAWNTYVVLLATGEASYAEMAALAAIEEDLTGTRKIARSDIKDISDVEAALLPLLPLQSAPKLDSVDMVFEIRQRATELPPRAVDAFVSRIEESVVLQVIEETP
jgi:hypothetical protein